VRRLAFGPEASFVHHAGLYVATMPFPREIDPQEDIMILNAPGRSVTFRPSRDNPIGASIFWKSEIAGLDHYEGEQHKGILEQAFGNLGWRVPEMLGAMRATGQLYFDSVSKIIVADWARGRTALVGDASSCVSLFGDGTTLAIARAYALAGALASTDHARAFRLYQTRHGKMVAGRQRNVARVASILVPRTEFGIALRNRVVALAGSAQAGAKRLRRWAL
jgi:2-polyprenyl-6-methoxyphenol hydroxylase-like FAD-dependent oxidoreductase